MHNQYTRLCRQPGHLARRRKIAAERLLADDPRHAGGYRLFDHRNMRFRRRRDIQYVDPAAVQKRGEIGVAPDTLRNGRGRAAVGDGNKTRTGDPLPGGMMELRKIAGAGAGGECLGRWIKLYVDGRKGSPQCCRHFSGARFALQ